MLAKTSQKLDGKLISGELIRNMELGQFEMAYAILLPCNFTIYLNPEDHAILSGVFGLIAEDARRALRARVLAMNAPPRFAIGKFAKAAKEFKIACQDWHLEFLPDPEVPINDIEIHSEYSETVQPGFRGTRTTLLEREPTAGLQRMRGVDAQATAVLTTTPSIVPAADASSSVAGQTRATVVTNGAAVPEKRTVADERVYAEIRYRDDTGDQVYLMTRNEVRIGRGGGERPMDVALYTTDEVSREHLVIRRVAATGVFVIQDLSTNGTSVDGKRLTRGEEEMLSTPASIDVGEVILLSFEARA
jgi:hypothetical protein